MDEHWELSSDEEDAFEGSNAFIMERDDVDDIPSDDMSPGPSVGSPYERIFGTRRMNIQTPDLPDFLRVFGARRRYRDEENSQPGNPEPWFTPVTEPQQPGLDLQLSGEFGCVGNKGVSRLKRWNVAKIINHPGVRLRASAYIEDISSDLVPNTNGTVVAVYDSNVYTGQFSADSSFYYTCAQDFRLRIYDMLAPPTRNNLTTPTPRRQSTQTDDSHYSTLTILKTIQGHEGSWTITDSHLSPDNQRLIYSSLTSTVYMAYTMDSTALQVPIPFADPNPPPRIWNFDFDTFPIWSCRFSADGNEVVAGGHREIFVYDLPANRRTVSITAHEDDINSCCWADTQSGNVLVSASDDTFIKVWDRRSLGSSSKPSGVLIGHTEGITYVSAKGDGRYVISNGKDQALRLWDLRKMHSNAEFERVSNKSYGSNFDYRHRAFPKPKYLKHPQDCSVMTYRGHSVLRTLIRCHFSPLETTGGQYLYSGSANGKIHIWSLDGRVVQVLDRAKTLPMAFDPSGPEPEATKGIGVQTCVRDLAWHSQEPMIMSAAWDIRKGGSIIARHEWKGMYKMPGALEDWIEKRRQEQSERRGNLPERVPASFDSDEEN